MSTEFYFGIVVGVVGLLVFSMLGILFMLAELHRQERMDKMRDPEAETGDDPVPASHLTDPGFHEYHTAASHDAERQKV